MSWTVSPSSANASCADAEPEAASTMVFCIFRRGYGRTPNVTATNRERRTRAAKTP
jgi:hypothetical protein